MTAGKEPKFYYPDNFRWPECPVSALRGRPGFDAIAMAQQIAEARAVGGRAAVWSLVRRDPRLFDAALVVESCRVAEHNARLKVLYPSG